MVKLKRSYYIFLKALLGIGLFIAFLYTSAEPSLANYYSRKVMTDASKIQQKTLMTPAATICVDMVT